MKKTLSIFIIGIIISSGSLALIASAQDNTYTVLAPLPGIGDTDSRTTTLKDYVPALFKLAIGLSAVAAVVMIVIGGFQYMTSDALKGKESGRERVKNAVIGLVLVITAYLILWTINPKLLELNLSIDPVSTVGGQTGTDGTGPANPSSFGCTDCTTVGSSIPVKNGVGSQLSSSIMNSVVGLDNGLDSQHVGWRITEGYPPTYTHLDSCHNNGTCFDAGLSNPTVENIKRFIETARNNGLSPTYEVTDESQVAPLTQALSEMGLSNPPIEYNSRATGPHFHVEG